MQAWGKKTSFWTYTKLLPAIFRANTLYNRLFLEPPTVYRGKHVSRYFHHSYLKANKVSKSEGTRKVKYIKKERLVLREIHLRTTGCHLSIGSHSITCHPTEVTAPPSPISYAYHFWKCDDDVDRKLSKLTYSCQSYSLLKLACFLRHSVFVFTYAKIECVRYVSSSLSC